MKSKADYQRTLHSLRQVRRLAHTLSKTLVRRLRIADDDVADAEYVTEWMEIVCRQLGRPSVVRMPAFDKQVSLSQQFHWFICKADRQAGVIRRGLLFGRIEKEQFAEEAWDGLDSAEIFLQSFLSRNVSRERGPRR